MALVAKPAGPTSHDVVDQVRRALATPRVGHLGTLDPFAEGLLVVVVGRATRLAPFAAGWPKAYEGVIRLGVRTATDDCTGQVLARSDAWRSLDEAEIRAALEGFRGGYEQRPPAFSAVKVGGERAHRRARRGEPVALAARRVEVRELEVVALELPAVRFRATVSAGTYLRSLARDVGEALRCGGHLAVLRRTRVGPFALDQAVPADRIAAGDLREPDVLVADLPRRDLDAATRDAAVHGRAIPDAGEEPRVALFASGQLVAVAEREGCVLKPRVVLADA